MKKCLFVLISFLLFSGFSFTYLGKRKKAENWFEKSIYILHEDHHIREHFEVGKNTDLEDAARLIALSRPDVIQMHAKGRPGFTTYPTKVGFMPPKFHRDVLGIWRDIARKDGYHFSVYYNLGRDTEIEKRKPAWNRVTAEGKPQDAALCYHSGVAEGYLWPMIEEIMENYRPDGLWFDGSVFTIRNCYCAVCKTRFRKETGLEAPAKPTDRGWAAYKDMQRNVYREFLYQTVDRIKAKDPRCLVAINLAYSLNMPEAPYPGLDYLTADFGNEMHVLSQEAHWYDGQGKPFEIMTTVHLGGKNGKEPKPKDHAEQELAIILANGGRYDGWDNPDTKSALSGEIHEHLRGVVAPFLRARQPWCLQSERVPDISLLFSAAAHYAAIDSVPACFRNANYLVESTDKLWQAGLNYEMVSDHRLERQDVRSPLLLVENPGALSESNIKSIKKYVESGGSVLVTGSGVALRGMNELLGLHIPQKATSTEALLTAIDGKPVRLAGALYPTQAKGAEVLLSARDGKGKEYPLFTRRRIGKGQAFAAVFPLLGPDEKSSLPAGLVNAIVKKVLPLEHRHLLTNAPATVEPILRKKESKHIVHLVNHAEGKREVLKMLYGKPYYKITDVPAVPATHISLQLDAKPTSVKLQPENREVQNWQYKNGRLEADIPSFPIHQMVVVE